MFTTVDCVWHEWSEWEHCNVTCAWGQQRRQRGKDDEQYGGDACTGNDVDWQDCFPRHCPGRKDQSFRSYTPLYFS